MVKQTIQIFLRFRPPSIRKSVIQYNVHQVTGGDRPCVTLNVNREVREYDICNRRELYNFQFDGIFDVLAGQDQVFDAVAKPVIEKALEGYNGTIFAYGQTGSGKTFTITGGGEKYTDRGIIPRTIEYIFRQSEKNLEEDFEVSISYLEIYNENGYDLLDTRYAVAKKMEDLPRVTLFEDTEAGTVHLRNLSIHPAVGVDEALNLLFTGDTNRIIAETPTNEASSRSHCIFTLHITSRSRTSSTVRRAKLHLVDLAGSERVYKSGIDGTTLTEAKYINLSLHYLEQVIVALSEKQRSHIPYRNSMMTMILRDSLGGNCMTSMIANCSAEQCNIQETIATCRFAQRVALIKNDMILNEEQDPHVVIGHLKAEIERLKAELAFTTGTEQELTEEEKERCERMVDRFLSTSTENEPFSFPAEMFSNVQKICFCLKLIQELHGKRMREGVKSRSTSETKQTPAPPPENQETEELRRIIAQKDHEIHVLIGLLKRGQTGEHYVAQLEETAHDPVSATDEDSQHDDKNDSTPKLEDERDKACGQTTAPNNVVQWLERGIKDRLLGSLANGREQAFQTFKREHHSTKHVEAKKTELRSLYAEAKNYANEMCLARNEVDQLQTKLNDLVHNETSDQCFRSNELEAVRSMLDTKRATYRTAYSKLRELRQRIKHLQHALETAKVRLIQDFEQWWHHQSPASQQVTPLDTTAVEPVQTKNHPGDGKMESNIWQPASSVVNSRQVQKVQKTINEVSKPAHLNNNSLNSNGAESYFGKIPLTGDPAVDADILAFVHAREEFRRRQTEQQDQ